MNKIETEMEQAEIAAAGLQDQPVDYPQPEFQPVNVAQSTTYTAFADAIKARVVERLTPVGTPQDLIESFSAAFVEEVDNILTKFADGQLKHGGDIRDRDLLFESTSEVRDLVNYFICMRLQRLCIRVPIE